MKKLILLVALFFSVASVEISARVCLADGNTPFEYRDIMVGTKLTIIVDSNVAEDWGGALKLFHMAEYCDTAQSKERSNREYKVCL